MNVERVRSRWITRRRYVAFILVVCLAGGYVAGALLAEEATGLAVATLGLTAALVAIPRLLATRPIFDERDCRLDRRAAQYTMYPVTALSVGFLVGPIALEQLGLLAVQGWMLVVGLTLLAQVYLFVGTSLVLRYTA